jgi:hypothetical protein
MRLVATLCLNLAHEAREIRTERMGDAIHIEKAEVAQTPLHIADVGSVDAHLLRQSLLGQAAGGPKPSDSLSKVDEEFGFLTLGHFPTLEAPQTMGLQTMSGEC